MVESFYTEFKRELNDKLEKEVVSFLNSKGGHLYFGISNDGTTYGLDDIDNIQLEVKDRLKDKIAPSPIGFFEILVEEKNNVNYLHIIVASGNEKPYYLKKYGMSPSGVIIRVGSSCGQATEKQIYSMFSRRTRTSLINIISPVQNLSFKQLRIYYEESGYQFNKNTFNQLNFYLETGEYNYLAYLLSDNNALVINVGKFEGDNVINLEELSSYTNQSLIKTTFEIIEKIESYNKTTTIIKSPRRIEKKLFDSIAIREAVVNALVHSDYSYENSPTFKIFDDHIEIISVGGLPEGIEQDEFLDGYMSPKNPQLMKAFRDVKLVEHMGTGIMRILNKYDKNVFIFKTNFIKVSFPFNEIKKEQISKDIVELTERQMKIIDIIKENKKIIQEEIANLLSVSRYTIIRELKEMESKGIIKRNGSNKTGYWEILKNE